MSSRTMDTQSSIAKAGTQVSTGVAIQRPSDDPVRWADGMRTKLSMDRRDMHESTVERARDNLTRVDAALTDLLDGVARIRELGILGANGTYDAPGRAAAAIEIATRFDSMLASANVRSIDGEYLLAGSNSEVAPFDAAGVYTGNDVARTLEVNDGTFKQAGVTGTVLTAAEGVDLFGTIVGIQAALEANDGDATRGFLDDLVVSLEQLAYAMAETGVTSNSLDQSLGTLDDLELSLSRSFEGSIGADPIEAATWLANLSNELEASRVVSERIVSLMSLGS
ncbi:MAG: hypothetical protein KUG77_08425 [Nannocystaceae bacterium]|nr:hypothetical protein [Nannocystaceae bacterium]